LEFNNGVCIWQRQLPEIYSIVDTITLCRFTRNCSYACGR